MYICLIYVLHIYNCVISLLYIQLRNISIKWKFKEIILLIFAFMGLGYTEDFVLLIMIFHIISVFQTLHSMLP